MAAYSNQLFEQLGITGRIIELGKRFNEIDKMAAEDVNVLIEEEAVDDTADVDISELTEESVIEDSDDEYYYEMNTDGIYDNDYYYAEQEVSRLEFVQDKYAEFAREFGYESD
uniref:Uncharacterized protein n=1 Tax=viral metagenome TaxID=1070528 RepID=A0A6C0HY61_9ZZZZ